MHFQQIYLPCLAQASYLVGDGGECAVIDPRRDVEVYLEEAARQGLKIRHILETHLHADFVSGHVELARRTGATVHVSHRAGAAYPHHALRAGDEIVMGAVALRVLETPGHTPESLCFLVIDRSGAPAAGMATAPGGGRVLKVLTGDTLFIGDVGRPDLVSSKGRSAREMASLMYDSLHEQLLKLPDEVEVWPAHGAGSACGRNISKELSSTIGAQRRLNPMLQPMSREDFIALATAGLPPSPRYFGHDAELNRQGAPMLSELPAPADLAPHDVLSRQASGSIVLDVRDKEAFGAGHVPGALNIGLGGSFASWAGSVLPLDGSLVLVAADRAGRDEAVMRLARVGLHGVSGWLAGGWPAWLAAGLPVSLLPQLPVQQVHEQRSAAPSAGGAQGLFLLDVRGPGEYATVHARGAWNLPLPELQARLAELDPRRPTAVICASAYRSSLAASLLARAGFKDLHNVAGGTNAWVAAGLPTESAELAAT
ncbi:MAG: MBL fold metallo-hydrolase [Planctomycetota bacterium]